MFFSCATSWMCYLLRMTTLCVISSARLCNVLSIQPDFWMCYLFSQTLEWLDGKRGVRSVENGQCGKCGVWNIIFNFLKNHSIFFLRTLFSENLRPPTMNLRLLTLCLWLYHSNPELSTENREPSVLATLLCM